MTYTGNAIVAECGQAHGMFTDPAILANQDKIGAGEWATNTLNSAVTITEVQSPSGE